MLLLALIFACTGTRTTETAGETGTAACELPEPGTRLDLVHGCADGLCGGTVYPDAVALLGAPDGCTPGDFRVLCAWGDLSADFPDCDEDGAPDEEPICDQFDQTLTVSGGWDGADPAGLGLGVTAACWEAALGAQAGGWEYGTNPVVGVSVSPTTGPVETVTLRWTFDE